MTYTMACTQLMKVCSVDLTDITLNSLFAAIRGESIIEQIRFFTKLILNSDEADF